MSARLEFSSLWLQAVLLTGLVARVVVLITRDKILDGPRRRLSRLGWPWLTKLLECPVCVGVWIAAGSTAGWMLWPRPTLVVSMAASAALAGSLLAAWYAALMYGDDDRKPE